MLLLLAPLLLFPACDQSEGSGIIQGSISPIAACPSLPRALPVDLNFFGLEKVEDGIVEIRVQPDGRGMEDSDGLLVQIYDIEQVIQRRGRRISFVQYDPDSALDRRSATCPLDPGEDGDLGEDDDGTRCPLVRLTLYFNHTCPDLFSVPFFLQGDIMFTHLGTEPGNRIAASLRMEVWDGRREVLLADDLHGQFDFVMKRGQPFQRFVN